MLLQKRAESDPLPILAYPLLLLVQMLPVVLLLQLLLVLLLSAGCCCCCSPERSCVAGCRVHWEV
jgi:hypothetical protein